MTRERIKDFKEVVLPFFKNYFLKENYENLGKSDAEEFENDFKEIIELADKALEQEWIPASEKLPNDRDWYLGIFKEPDTGWINPLPFICDYVGSETKATTKEHWILRGFTDRDGRIDYYFNLECVAWMPLPKAYEPQLSEHEKFILSQMVNSDAKTIEEIGLMRQKQLAEIYQHCGCQKIEPQESEE